MFAPLFLRAPHTVRPASDDQEGQLSTEEQEKRWDSNWLKASHLNMHAWELHLHQNDLLHRTEAASNVLKKSVVRQRSYVLSAAKKFEYVCLNLVILLIWMLSCALKFLTHKKSDDTLKEKPLTCDWKNEKWSAIMEVFLKAVFLINNQGLNKKQLEHRWSKITHHLWPKGKFSSWHLWNPNTGNFSPKSNYVITNYMRARWYSCVHVSFGANIQGGDHWWWWECNKSGTCQHSAPLCCHACHRC